MAVQPHNEPSAVPASLPAWMTPALIAHTLEVWQPHYPCTLTRADAVEILLNMDLLIDALEDCAS